MERGRRHLKGKKQSHLSGKRVIAKNSPSEAARKPSASEKHSKAQKAEPQVSPKAKNMPQIKPDRGKATHRPAAPKKRIRPLRVKAATKKTPAGKVVPKQKIVARKSLVKNIVTTFLGKAAKKENPGRKDARKKQRGRLARSIENRSRLAVLLFLFVVIGLIVGVSIYQKGETNRLIEDLKLFSIPKKADDFRRGSEPCVNTIIARGEKMVPPLLARYPKMNHEQKTACVYALGELLKKTSNKQNESLREPLRSAAIDILKKAVLNYHPSKPKTSIIKEFAIRSAAKMGESLAKPFLRDVQKQTPRQQNDLLEAVARTQTKAAETNLLQLTKEGDDVFREIVAAKLIYFQDSSSAILRLFEMAKDIDYPKTAARALFTLEKLLEKEKLEKDIVLLAGKIKSHFTQKLRKSSNAKAVTARARLLALMGVLGAVENLPGKDASLFQKYLREYLGKTSPEEIAAAAYGLGIIRDIDYVREIMEKLDYPDANVTAKATDAIVRLENPETLDYLFAIQDRLVHTKKQYVLKAVAKILQKFYFHAIQDESTDMVVELLTKIFQNAKGDTKIAIAKTLALYKNND